MKVALMRRYDVANGPGIRTSLFVSGCDIHCPNCFNKEFQDREYGLPFTKEVEIQILNWLSEEYVSGLSILGGEPFEFANEGKIFGLFHFITNYRIKDETKNKSIWIWSGHTFEELCNQSNINKTIIKILQMCDVLVDGPFIEEYKDMNLVFRGSKNQRLIDLKKTFNNSDWKVELIDEETLIH